jgi:hypothetical protein
VSAVEPQRPRTEAPPTIRGYRQDEVVGALQKTIRRGLEDDALYWAVELHESGWGEHCWSRLFVIVCEDGRAGFPVIRRLPLSPSVFLGASKVGR